jgi:hypothetical protein
MDEQKHQHVPSPTVGERQEVYRQALYGMGVLRPTGPEDVAALGLASPATLPTLVVLATEHPHLPPPRLVLQELGGELTLVLSWLEYDPLLKGRLPEVADVTYAWPIQGPIPRLLVIRKVPQEDAMAAALSEIMGPESTARSLSLTATEGPGVSLDPSFFSLGVELFFGQYGQSKPAGLADSLLLVGLRPTASGRAGRALGAAPLKGGGVRVRVAVPLDPGLPIWGPRVADRVDVFAFPYPGGRYEWLLELE